MHLRFVALRHHSDTMFRIIISYSNYYNIIVIYYYYYYYYCVLLLLLLYYSIIVIIVYLLLLFSCSLITFGRSSFLEMPHFVKMS